MDVVIDISDYDKEWITNGYYIPEEINTKISEAIANGIPLSELKDRWKSSYEQMRQEKICELNKRKKELENQLNISVQNIIANEMIMCCEKE